MMLLPSTLLTAKVVMMLLPSTMCIVKVVVMLLLATNYIPVVINHILMAFYTSAVPSHCKVGRISDSNNTYSDPE